MSLPPGFLDELRNRVPISRVIGPRVVWDQHKSNQARGDWWAPCPFHQEKTASFHCDDQKGFYYCFGCQAKGDALTFLRELDGLDFIEAVKVLAADAGMEVPEPDPRARERQDRRAELADVTEAANRWFRLQLQTAGASAARDYLARRGLDAQTLERFQIGFAPNSRTALTQALRDKGMDEALIVAAGMSAKPDDGRAAYDRFRDRIIFPIRDGRDRIIGFGGRAMAADARAKYLNSPETPLFDKGRNLYHIGPARTAVAKGAPLLVAEGYMDVIALVRAGFEGAVAPLGTAITEDQLRLMWRVSPEPVIMLDGDAAGQRAALRLVDLALPMTAPGQALRFATMPVGQDPDDLIASEGAGAMAAIIAGARPLVDLLWQRETEGRVFDSPERKAALDHALRKAIAVIPDEATRAHYAAEIRDKRAQLFGAARKDRGGPSDRGQRGGGGGWQPRAKPGSEPARAQTRASVFVSRDAGAGILEGEVLLRCALHPEMIELVESRLERLQPTDPDRAALLHDLLAGASSEAGARALENLKADAHLGLVAAMTGQDDPQKSEAILSQLFDRLDARRAERSELTRAEAEIAGEADEGLTWRVTQITRARQRAEHPEMEDSTDLGENRDELSAQLADFVAGEIWRKNRK
ncbi:DNA primase [Paracoccus tegillarcae]|uniref:DNA primase n=1 Tax=Paracoccus tegillarcae TaxID=1529068 RepID=A0A2K9EIB7_9RHOB|nr:DNA primase [Paracoccus tegillarcae]AUH34738.1 DNA primase [Paracoccus tegillarcae]